MTRKLIILTDPGQDQAAAILTILGQKQAFEVLGLVATAGNINLDHTIANCLKLMELAGRPDIPVFAGCSHPIIRPLVTAEHVHGPTGLDGPDLPPPSIKPQEKHGIDFIIDTVCAHPGEVTICSLSPVTNLAMALRKAPDIAGKIHEVVAMLGAYFEVGNITPAAEFNCYVDPEAADVVLKAGIKTTLLPLDVTHRMRSTPERLSAMRLWQTAAAWRPPKCWNIPKPSTSTNTVGRAHRCMGHACPPSCWRRTCFQAGRSMSRWSSTAR